MRQLVRGNLTSLTNENLRKKINQCKITKQDYLQASISDSNQVQKNYWN